MYLKQLLKFIFYRKVKFFIKKFIYQKKVINYDDIDQSNSFTKSLKKDGFCVVENFFNKVECNLIISKMDLFFKTNKSISWQDQSESEYRLHGAEKINQKIMHFFSDKLLINIGSKCLGRLLINLMTMANKIEYKSKNLGSGGGWHRDDVNFQFKAILYLNDVSEKNGAFELIKKSNNFLDIIKDSINAKLDVLNTRIDNTKVNLLEKKRIKTITGKAGTLILVDTSLIHRGRPLEEGLRYALTNYYYPYDQVESMSDHFLPKIDIN